MWSVNQSFHKRNENEFCTWVSLGILLLCSVYHIFHKRNENEFSKLGSLGIFLLWSVSHSFHKRNENDFATWVSSWQCVGFQSNRVMHLLWNVFVGYAFQPIEKFMAILFNLLKRFWLWFSTCWKHSGYGFQPVEKILAMLFNLLKNLWLCFSTCWKKSGYAFQLLKSYILWISAIWKV